MHEVVEHTWHDMVMHDDNEENWQELDYANDETYCRRELLYESGH